MKFPIVVRRIEGHSMWPTLTPDDIVVASSLAKIKTGSIVIARIEGKEYIKRVQSIENDSIWLLGDNYYHSRDSRRFGPVTKRQILGTVIGYPRTFNRLARSLQRQP